MKTFVIPDIHGHYETLQALLLEAGVIDGNDRLDYDNVQVVSLGDLANCVRDNIEGDLNCLSEVGNWIDKMIVGNHELPYLHGPAFGGFFNVPEVGERVKELLREGLLVPAVLVDDVLLSHAGVAKPKWQGQEADWPKFDSAEEAYEWIMARWEDGNGIPRYDIFANVGPVRGGSWAPGGIFWNDWQEPKQKKFSQIVGHTPQSKGPALVTRDNGTFTLCLDCGAKWAKGATGAWLEDGEIEYVSVPFKSNHVYNTYTGRWE